MYRTTENTIETTSICQRQIAWCKTDIRCKASHWIKGNIVNFICEAKLVSMSSPWQRTQVMLCNAPDHIVIVSQVGYFPYKHWVEQKPCTTRDLTTGCVRDHCVVSGRICIYNCYILHKKAYANYYTPPTPPHFGFTPTILKELISERCLIEICVYFHILLKN